MKNSALPLFRATVLVVIMSAVTLQPAGMNAASADAVVVNLHLPARPQTVVGLAGGRLAFAVSEAEDGSTDLNGDGDSGDTVVHVWEPATGVTTDLGLAISSPYADRALVSLADGGFAFGVTEGLQGRDLNGDGDTLDTVVHVWTPGVGTTNLGLAVTTTNVCCYWDLYQLTAVDGGGVTFTVPEGAQGGVDRNGDGDAKDNVAAVWRSPGAPPVNVGLAAAQLEAEAGGGLALLVQESAQHRTDLNGDGDITDNVVEVWRPGVSPTVVNLSLAATGVIALDDGGLGIVVDEAAQHGTDLNGDGDTADRVVAVWGPTGGVQNLGLALWKKANNSAVALSGGRLALVVSESQQGNRDLNGDGDTADKVIHIWDEATRQITNLRRPGDELLGLRDGGLAFNSGSRLMVWRPFTGVTSVVGFRANGAVHPTAGGGVVFGVAEFGPAKQDLNGDGDRTDYSDLFVWDPQALTAWNLRLIGEGIPLAGGDFAFFVSEPSEAFDVAGNGNGDDGGVDFNGDGDGNDAALHVWNPVSGSANLHIAGIPVAALAGNSFAFLVPEDQQAYTDLDGDRDTTDWVLHIRIAS